jgi:hypothetical protein
MKIKNRRAYHGSPVSIASFDYGFTEKGKHQFLGSGFYFSTSLEDALSYASDDAENILGGMDINPTLHTVSITLKNPLPSKFEGEITHAQVCELINLAPKESREDGLWAWGDIGNESIDRVVNRAAKAYAGDQTILMGLHNISNDFFADEPQAFNVAVQKVLGYDGVIHALDDGKNYHLLAWFPDQIQILARKPAAQAVRELVANQAKFQEEGTLGL